MLVLRNAAEGDVDALAELAGSAGTAPRAAHSRLRSCVEVAAASFAGACSPSEAAYLFVLEDLSQSRVCGISVIPAVCGGALVRRAQSSRPRCELPRRGELRAPYLHPGYHAGINYKLLSMARLLFLVQFPDRFAGRGFAGLCGFEEARDSRLVLALPSVLGGATPTLLATTRADRFRAIVAACDARGSAVVLASPALDALACGAGAPVRMQPLSS